ncbi:MAG: hypothetical protein ACLP5V_05510 [Candidatus Bathyarchaeia archaeon]
MRLTSSIIAYVLILAAVVSFALSPVSAQTYPTDSFSLSGTSVVACWYWGVMFDATQSQRFTVTWSETDGTPTSLDLYIVAPSSMGERWFCDTGPVELYYNSGAFGSANWVARSGGEYIVLVVNDNYGSASGMLSIMAANATVRATSIGYAMARQPPLCLANDCSPSTNG